MKVARPPSPAEEWAWRSILGSALAFGAWSVSRLDWSGVMPSFQFLLVALGRSWILALCAVAVGVCFAIPLALGRSYGNAVVRYACGAVVELVRATPELMLIFLVYFVAPVLTHTKVDAWNAALAALTIVAAAYLAEVIRAGIGSVPREQREAAAATGMSSVDVFRFIVLPQSLRNMLPALVAQLVSLFKSTSLASAIGVMDFFRAVSVTNNAIVAPLELYVVMALGYFLSCWSITLLIERFDPKYQLVD